MSMFYTARHGAPRTASPAAKRAGAGVLAATALGLGAGTVTATSASANGGPEAPTTTESAPTTTESAPAPTQSDSGESTFSDIVEKGDTGDVVEDIQDEVGVSTDGVFGSETEQAVKAFQSDHGLAADGIVGSDTAAEMGLTGSGSTDSDSGSTETSSDAATTESADSTESAGAQSVSTSSTGSSSDIVDTARGLVGSPYEYGGTSPEGGFDCSGFVAYVMEQHGKELPRTASAQQDAATPVSDPQPGDVVFFGDNAYHNGIYAGDGKIIDAGNESTGVTERDIWTDDVSYGRF